MRQLTARLGRLVLVLCFLAVACGDETTAAGFDADLGPIDPDLEAALQNDEDPTAVPEVQRNFLTGCVKGFEDSIPELEPVQRAGPDRTAAGVIPPAPVSRVSLSARN